MPVVVVACVFGMCAIIYGLYYATKAIVKKIEIKKSQKQQSSETTEQ